MEGVKSHGKPLDVHGKSVLMTQLASVAPHSVAVSISALKNVISYLTIPRCNANIFCAISALKVTINRGSATNHHPRHVPDVTKTQRETRI